MKKLSTKNSQPSTVINGKAELITAPSVPKKFHAKLTQWESRIDKTFAALRKKEYAAKYNVVDIGLGLLKIRQIYRLTDEDRARLGGEAKAASSHMGESTAGRSEGFAGWLEAHPEMPNSTAYRYINAALNCDLTENSTTKALKKLRAEKALANVSFDDLYKSPKQISSKSSHAGEQQELNLVSQTIHQNRELCESLISLRSEMNDEQFEVVTDRLRETLEKLTGAKWDIVDSVNPQSAIRNPQ